MQNTFTRDEISLLNECYQMLGQNDQQSIFTYLTEAGSPANLMEWFKRIIDIIRKAIVRLLKKLKIYKGKSVKDLRPAILEVNGSVAVALKSGVYLSDGYTRNRDPVYLEHAIRSFELGREHLINAEEAIKRAKWTSDQKVIKQMVDSLGNLDRGLDSMTKLVTKIKQNDFGATENYMSVIRIDGVRYLSRLQGCISEIGSELTVND